MRFLKLLPLSACWCALMLSNWAFGQITTTGGLSAQNLASILSGSNITVSNVVYGGSPLASGSFTSGGGFQFESGIILTTGTLQNCEGPNNDPNTSDNLGYPGDPQMALLGGANSWDAVWLEFDFLVQSTSVQFEYIFGSEDYPEAAPPNNPTFNDVFAFYISGPGIVGTENIALIPGTTSEVSIDNVNPVTNQQYYIDNAGGQEIQFDGYTTPLIAFKDNLIPCGTYHLKLIISDIHNTNRNSAVFLKENSFVQENVLGVETQTVNADTTALEGCIPGSFTFEFDQVSNQDRIINYQIAGTAVNGVDYSYLDTSILIPAGQTIGTVIINAFSDGLTEGQETIMLIYPSGGCFGLNDTAYLFINDAQPIEFTLDGTNLDCFNDFTGEILVNPAGGFPPYTYEITYPNGTVSSTQSNPVTGLAAGTYSVQVTDSYGCEADALVIGGIFDADTTFLPDVPNGQVTTYDAPLIIQGFNPGQTIGNVGQIQQICATMEHSYLGDLQITVESPTGQIVILKEQNGGGSCDLGEPFASGPVDGQNSNLTDPGVGFEYCWNANPIFGTMVNESNNFTHTIAASTGGTYTDNYLPAGSYASFESFNNLVGSEMNGTWEMHVTDQFGLDNGYIFNWYISLIGDQPDTLITLTQPDEILVTAFTTNSTCGASNGSINLDVENAVAPYTVQWSSGQTTEDLSGISAGTYTATVTDANGCQSVETFIVNNIGSLDITGTVTAVSCNGGSNGGVNISPSGGQAPYTFSWSSGQTTEDISGVPAGNYVVTMTDQQGCVHSESFTITQANAIVISNVTISNEQCNTDNGAISIMVNGGSGSYGYQWSNGAATAGISGLSAGIYAVNIIDGNGCTGTGSYTVINDVSNCSAFCYLEIEENVLVNENCGNANGSIDVNILNGVPPLTYAWSNGASSQDISNLSAGSYTLTVTDGNNCSEEMTFTVANNTGSLSLGNALITEENCGNQNGAVNVTVSGGAQPYAFSWSNGATTEDIGSLYAGNYTLTLTDGNGCVLTETYTVDNNAGSLAVSASIYPEYCSSSNGSINQTVNGANGTVTYAWSNGQTTQDIANIPSGSYTCTIADATGCYITENYTVSQQSGNISITGAIVTNEMCGNNQGAVNITTTGSNLSYLWSNGATTQDISGVSAGSYSCVISNGQGCSLTSPVYTVINSSGSLNVSTQLVVDEVCGNANGSINLNVSGGAVPYTYAWSNGAVSQDIVDLTAGTYTVVVSDANGCTESHSISVGASSGTLAIQNAVITDESCGNGAGAINVILAGGNAPYTYLWSTGQVTQDLTGLSAGQYSITVTDLNGCSVNETYTISNQAGGLNVIPSIVNELCSNGQGQISLATGGGMAPYSFLWSNGATTATISSLSAGTYSCVVTDNNGCSISTGSIAVGNAAGSLTVNASATDASCSNNGAINLTVSGASGNLTYNWSNGATTQNVSGLAAGTYTYTVSDANNCQVSGTEIILQTNGGLSYSYTTTSEVCNNNAGAINLTPSGASGPYTYLWSNGSTNEDLSGLSEGSFTCTITAQGGCTVTTSPIQVSNLSGSLSINDLLVSNQVCTSGLGSIDLVVSGGTAPLTYSWTNGALTQDIANLNAGTYGVTVSDAAGCQASAQAVVNVSSGTLSITQPIVTAESCSNGQGAINISVIGAVNPTTYLWSNGATTQDLTNLTAGTYTVTVSDINGCVTSGSYTVNNAGNGLSFGNAMVTDEYCGSGTGAVTISVVGGTAPYTYAWSNGATSQNLANVAAGTYTVTVTSAGNCQAQASYTVQNNAGNLTVSGVVTDENCGDGLGAIDVSVSGGNAPIQYLWSSGQTSQDLSNLSANTYTLTVTDNYGCAAGFTGSVANITNGLSVTLASVSPENCGNSDGAVDVNISGAGIVSTVWSSGQTSEDISGLSAGTYTLTVTNSLGCIASLSTTVANNTGNLAITFSNVADENCQNGQGFVDIEVGGTGPFSYQWSNGATLQDAVNLSAGNYTVVVTDGLGCELTQTFAIGNQNSTNLSGNITVSDAICSSSNGEIDLSVTGGVGPYTFSWSNGATTEDLTGLSSGMYNVIITDAANCAVTEVVNVGIQSSGLAFDGINVNDEFCGGQDGFIFFSTVGNPSAVYFDGVQIFTNFIDNLDNGQYLLEIEDVYGCTEDTLLTVGSNGFFDVSGTATAASCGQNDGSINITVSNGGGPGGNFTYLWSTGQTTQDLSNVGPGTYTVTVTSGGGFPCSVDYTIIVPNNSTFTMSNVITPDYCGTNSGSINQIVVTGTGLQYLWSNGATTQDITGLSAGTYSCTITDPAPGGCVETFNYVVPAQTNGMNTSAMITDEECLNGSGAIDVSLSGGTGPFTYQWSNAAQTEDITGLSAGNYTLTVVDQNDNCVLTATYVVNNVDAIFAGSGVVTNASGATAGDGAINVSLTNSSSCTFVWSNGATTEDISGLNPGTYTLIATTIAGCDTTMIFTVLNAAGMDELTEPGISLHVFPNPASDKFVVAVSIPEGVNGTLEFTNAFGQVLDRREVQHSEEIDMDGTHLANGLYFIRLHVDEQSKVLRLVLTKD